jgi:hypothetical protein
MAIPRSYAPNQQSLNLDPPHPKAEPMPPVIIVTTAAGSSVVSTHYLLCIAHRMLADNTPDLKSVAIVREGAAFQGGSLKVVLTREDKNKITETWGWAT